MGVLDNLKKIRQSSRNKNAVGRIARKAIQQGAIENKFLSEYNSFSVSLTEVLDRTLVHEQNKSITIRGNMEENKLQNARYLNYVLEDPEYKELYYMERDVSGSITFTLKEFIFEDDEDLEEQVNEHDYTEEYRQQLGHFLKDK